MEALGTFALLYTIQTAASAASSAFPFAIGLVLVVFIYIGATVSGSNFNPAVTVGLFLRGKMSFGKGIQYIIAQLVGKCQAPNNHQSYVKLTLSEPERENLVQHPKGGVLGSFLGKLSSGSISVPHTGKDYNLIQALIVEAIFTAFLLVIVLGCMTMAANKDNQFYGVAIGLTITVGIICARKFHPTFQFLLHSLLQTKDKI